jgi:hypothetical protein
MSDEFSVALVCLTVAAFVWLAATRDRGAVFDDIVGGVAVTAAFAGCFLITLGVTSATGIASVVAVTLLIAAGSSLARGRRAVTP